MACQNANNLPTGVPYWRRNDHVLLSGTDVIKRRLNISLEETLLEIRCSADNFLHLLVPGGQNNFTVKVIHEELIVGRLGFKLCLQRSSQAATPCQLLII